MSTSLQLVGRMRRALLRAAAMFFLPNQIQRQLKTEEVRL